MKKLRRRVLTIPEVLVWIDLHHETTGRWPTRTSGAILGSPFDTWYQIDAALRQGLRGLPGGSSLARLLAERRGVRNVRGLPPLSAALILQWADEHIARTGDWPTAKSGPIPGSNRERWQAVDTALRLGLRELSGGSSLARLLAERRGVRNRKQLPHLTEELILAWADAHFRRTGRWPMARSGAIPEAPGETWLAVQMALRLGRRGLPGGTSLPLLLAAKRGARNFWSRPNLTIAMILAWIDGFHARTGGWPDTESGAIAEAPQETWCAVNHALRRGRRGLPGGSSLAALLAAERGVRNPTSVPRLARRKILAWADAHFRRTRVWPTADSGPIPEAAGETWAAVNAALVQGARGLRGGSSLARLLAAHRGKRHHLNLPPLSQKQILAWADAHNRRAGAWPNVNSGPVHEAPGERWDAIDDALRAGHRRLPGGSSLLRLLVKKRGVRDPLHLPPLTEAQIVHWAELHRGRTGAWPKYGSGAIADAPGETWSAVDSALRYGKRTLTGGSSLAKLLARAKGAAPGSFAAAEGRRQGADLLPA